MARTGLLEDEVVDVVEALPELAALPPERRPMARRALRARAMVVRRGRWDASADARLVEGGIGFLVLDGALVRCVTAAHRTAGELLGPGDVLRPCRDADEQPPFGTYWRAVDDVRVAVLDARFTRAAAYAPEVLPALIAGVGRRTGAVGRQLVIVQSQAVEARVLTTLEYLAGRWGSVTDDGLVLPAFLSHGTLALLLGARRPSVTSAMVRLTARGLVERREDGRWVLHASARSAAPAAAA